MKTKTGNYFECSVKYDKMMENGAMKKVTEAYCVEAMSFAEAEKRITDETAIYSQGEFEVKKIAPASYSEVFINDEIKGDPIYFKAKLEFITIDEVTAKEKKTAVNYLVVASDFADSLRIVQESMSSSMMDYVTAKIVQSNILDIFSNDED